MIYHGTITMENGAELPFELYPEDAPRTVENFVKRYAVKLRESD